MTIVTDHSANWSLTISDPKYAPPEHISWFARIGQRLIRDPRDLPFLELLLLLSVTLLPATIILVSGIYFSWWFSALYVAAVIYWLGPFILMLHNISHRPCFWPKYRYLNYYVDWLVGPMFGMTPSTYFAHHIGMHHPENNLGCDLSSTLPYQRDSAAEFLRYFVRFIAGTYVALPRYLWRRGRKKLLWRGVTGELAYITMTLMVAFFDWRVALVVFIVPFVVARFGMMFGNWAQHAFIDSEAPDNNYRNSITCINTAYNRRCFNDGYHIGHHLTPTRHWTDMPGDFAANIETYSRENAIVFEGLDYSMISFLLMTKRYEVLARHVVDLGGHRGQQDTVALLRLRLRRVPDVIGQKKARLKVI